MATKHTLTITELATLAGNPHAKNIRAYVVTNLPKGEALIDTTTNEIMAGGLTITLLNGSGSVSLPATDATDLNVVANTVQYEVRAEYVDPATRGRETWRSGYFALTADADLADLATDASPMVVTVASQYAQEAKDARDDAVDISGISTTDTAVAALVNTVGGPLTQAALGGKYAQITQRPVNVLDYGADPTGATDSSTAIRNALAASGRIEFGKGGTFLVSRHSTNPWALSSPGDQVWSGNGATLKLANGTAPAVSLIRPLGNNVTIKDMTLDGNRANQSVETQKQRHGVFVDQADRITLSNIVAHDLAGDGIMLWRSTDYFTLRDCTVYDTDRNGMSLTGSGSRVLISGLTAYNVAAQGLDAECDTSGTYADVQVRDCYLVGAATDYAMDLTGLSTALATDWTIAGNTFKGGLHMVYFQRAKLANNTIDGTSNNKDCLTVEYIADGLQIIGNTFINAGTRRGIAASYIATNVIDRMTIRDNEFYLATGAAVQANGINRLKMIGNRASGTDTTNAFAAFKAEATRDVRSTVIEDNEAWGFARAVYTAGPNIHKYLRVANNYGHDDLAGGQYGVQLAGAASVYPAVTAFGNAAGSGVTSAYSPPTGVWVRRNNGVVAIFEGTGTPESVLTAPIGSIAIRRDGGAATVLYIKESGSGSTGWVAK